MHALWVRLNRNISSNKFHICNLLLLSYSVWLHLLRHVLANTLNINKFNLGFQIKSLKNQRGTDNPG